MLEMVHEKEQLLERLQYGLLNVMQCKVYVCSLLRRVLEVFWAPPTKEPLPLFAPSEVSFPSSSLLMSGLLLIK